MSRKEIIPLLHDHHNHPSQYASFFDSVDLSGIEDKKKALSWIKANCSECELNVVLGWNNSYYDFNKKDLKDLPPVIICNVSFHGFLSNQKAEERVRKRFGSTEILKRLKDPSWMEKNLPEIMSFLVKVADMDEEKIESFYDFLSEKGIWKVEDMLLPSEEVFEVFSGTKYMRRTEFWTDLDTYEELSRHTKEQIKGIKVFIDGALGPKTAALEETYLDGGRGVLIYEKEELRKLVKKIEKEKISIHAIGDRATREIILTLSELEKEGFSLPDIRLEHIQFVQKKVAKEAKKLGIKLCMQPNFSLDSVHYADRLSEKYLKMNNPFRMLIDDVGFKTGEDLIFGSDGMPHGVETALKTSLFPPSDGQKLSVREFREGYCLQDEKKGAIELKIDESYEEVSVEEIRLEI